MHLCHPKVKPNRQSPGASGHQLLHFFVIRGTILNVKGIFRTICLFLAAGGILLVGNSCSWKKASIAERLAADTRPEPKLKKGPYTVNGTRDRPMNLAQAMEYKETGTASVYEGGNTRGAIGERLPYGGMYAAHRTLPLPSTVRITSVATGKSCEVRVNDRGPFHRRRIIDISPSVARAIGCKSWGLHQVVVETISVGDGPNQRRRDD